MNQAEIKPIEARIMVKDGLTEVIVRKVEFFHPDSFPTKSYLTRLGEWLLVPSNETIPPQCYLTTMVYSSEPEKPVMDKINSRQLFGKPFVSSHPEIFSWEDCGNSSSPLYHPEMIRPDKVTVTFEVKVDIRRVR